MPRLDFDIAYSYPDGVTGIPVPIIVAHGDNSEKTLAKLDTGSEFCVFTNDIGRLLDIPIEIGRQGWIRNFHIGLIDYDNLLYLSPYR